MTKALILVDIQNDFLPGGALPVPEGDAVVPVANELAASGQFDLIVATQDWHPPDHRSFAEQHPGLEVGDVSELDGLSQILWPVHCMQQSAGASFASGLDVTRVDHVIRKGTDRMIDSYSGFFDNAHRKATGLHEWLRGKGVSEVHLVGLALDVCVKFTALDARELGYQTTLHRRGCRGVDLQPGDCDKALAEMQVAGVVVAS